ncbi:MAG: very short patch repair endonuclease [Bifidobacteriaceae bacterium]|jgi:DNA mismatch endonuclease (patch repair protein)|nr:very short patch repair endonuclease [Bifidobacteriaceae bacterium]
MQANRSRDTAPELAVRRALFARGLRYRVAFRPIQGERISVDVAFPGARVVVLVDGCFWHGCPKHHRAPQANSEYWSAKVARNRARDAKTNQVLAAAGWRVLRFWEHEQPEQIADTVADAVRAARR